MSSLTAVPSLSASSLGKVDTRTLPSGFGLVKEKTSKRPECHFASNVRFLAMLIKLLKRVPFLSWAIGVPASPKVSRKKPYLVKSKSTYRDILGAPHAQS